MGLIFKIAWRNILRHKGKSFVIGIIIFMGAFIMTLGNASINGMDKGLQKNISSGFLGDLVVLSTNQEGDNIVSGPPKSMEVIANYTNVKAVLEKQEYVEKFLPMGKGFAMILDEESDPGFAIVLGIKINDYLDMFDNNIVPVEGRMLKDGERGMLINSKGREKLYDMQGAWVVSHQDGLIMSNVSGEAASNKNNLRLKSNIIVMGASEDNSSFDIRAKVIGTFEHKQLNDLWDQVHIMDIESFRETFGYITAADSSSIEISADKQELLDMDDENMDDLFGDDSMMEDSSVSTADYSYENIKAQTKRDDTQKVDLDNGAFNAVFVKLKFPKDLRHREKYILDCITKLNNAFKEANVDARVTDWKKASGQIAQMADMMRVILAGFVFFIFFVAIIIIMNTLSMAAMERTSEIGMMRAIGAKKGFVGKMFFAETTMLAFIFGAAAMVIASLIVGLLASAGLSAGDNHFVQLLFGGNTFNPSVDMSLIIGGIIQLTFVTLLAMIYPIRVARRITPLEAITRE